MFAQSDLPKHLFGQRHAWKSEKDSAAKRDRYLIQLRWPLLAALVLSCDPSNLCVFQMHVKCRKFRGTQKAGNKQKAKDGPRKYYQFDAENAPFAETPAQTGRTHLVRKYVFETECVSTLL
jgi:hypothetical protein